MVADDEEYPTIHLQLGYNAKKWYNDFMDYLMRELTATGGQGEYQTPDYLPLYSVQYGDVNLMTPSLREISPNNKPSWRVEFKKPSIRLLKDNTPLSEAGKTKDRYGLYYRVRIPPEVLLDLEDTALKGARLTEAGDFQVLTITRMPASRNDETCFRSRLGVYDPGVRGELSQVCVKDAGSYYRFKRYGHVVGFARAEESNILDVYRRIEEKLYQVGQEITTTQQEVNDAYWEAMAEDTIT